MKTIHARNMLGFSLAEVIVVIAIVSILTTLAIPNYRTYLANQQAAALSAAINNALRLAKNLAIQQSTPIKVCALSSNNTSCNDLALNWTYGWQIINPTTNEILQRFQPSDPGAVQIIPASSITFSASGFPNPHNFLFTIKPTGCSQGFNIQYDVTTPGALLATQTINCQP